MDPTWATLQTKNIDSLATFSLMDDNVVPKYLNEIGIQRLVWPELNISLIMFDDYAYSATKYCSSTLG